MELINNGSAINVCLFQVAYCLGYKNKDFTSYDRRVRAYDNTRRNMIGILMLLVTFGSYQTEVKFHVLDIPASFNLLLGRPDIQVAASTLHLKIYLGLETGMLTIHGNS